MKFLETFKNYDIYIVCDKNTDDFQRLWSTAYPRINFIQFVNSTVSNSGFANSSSAISPQQIVNSWDKAIYYFSTVNFSYDNVWLIEDDVYFHSEQTLLDIDKQFPDSDLLTNKITPKSDDMKSAWHWHWCLIPINLPEPHFRAMVCATRVSKELFKCIWNYATLNNTLFYLETLFPTIASNYALKHTIPSELSTIEYRHDWNAEDINTTHLFHPIKNLDAHVDNRILDRFA